MNLQWVNSAGGPLVCASPAAGKMWRGTRGSSVGGVESDYERACDQTDYISVILCGSAQVLVLGDEPLLSAFALRDEGVIVVRWVSCVSNEHAANAIVQLPLVLPAVEEPKKIQLDDSGLIMFDAASDSVDPSSRARVNVKPGVFTVTTEKYKSEGACEFLVHRLLRDAAH